MQDVDIKVPRSAAMKSEVIKNQDKERKGKAGAATSLPSTSHQPPQLTFAALGAEAEVVDLASVAALAGDAGLALALPGLDVALAVGGAQRVAVAPGGGTDGHQGGTER